MSELEIERERGGVLALSIRALGCIRACVCVCVCVGGCIRVCSGGHAMHVHRLRIIIGENNDLFGDRVVQLGMHGMCVKRREGRV